MQPASSRGREQCRHPSMRWSAYRQARYGGRCKVDPENSYSCGMVAGAPGLAAGAGVENPIGDDGPMPAFTRWRSRARRIAAARPKRSEGLPASPAKCANRQAYAGCGDAAALSPGPGGRSARHVYPDIPGVHFAAGAEWFQALPSAARQNTWNFCCRPPRIRPAPGSRRVWGQFLNRVDGVSFQRLCLGVEKPVQGWLFPYLVAVQGIELRDPRRVKAMLYRSS